MVGRQGEISALLAAGEAVQAGLGRVVVIMGEPGLGKSRLAEEIGGFLPAPTCSTW